jgi:hypothetical protein
VVFLSKSKSKAEFEAENFLKESFANRADINEKIKNLINKLKFQQSELDSKEAAKTVFDQDNVVPQKEEDLGNNVYTEYPENLKEISSIKEMSLFTRVFLDFEQEALDSIKNVDSENREMNTFNRGQLNLLGIYRIILNYIWFLLVLILLTGFVQFIH